MLVAYTQNHCAATDIGGEVRKPFVAGRKRQPRGNFSPSPGDYSGVKRLRICAALAGIAAALALAASPAYAHAALTDSDPADGETLDTAPDTVTLEFSESLDPGSTKLALVGPDGAEIPTDPPQFNANAATLPIALPEPGTYTVSYRLVSEDGHPVDGTISFTSEKASATPPPPAPSTSDSSSAGAGDDGIGWGPVLAIAAGVVVIAAVVVVVVRRTKR